MPTSSSSENSKCYIYFYIIVFDKKPVETEAEMSQRRRLKPSAFVAFDKRSSEGNHE